MDSKGVTATRDSVAPAANPAITVAGPVGMDVSARRDLYVSKATNPVCSRSVNHWEFSLESGSIDLLMPALTELPMIMVVQPAYHCEPKGGQGSFLPSGNLRLSWDRVFATRLLVRRVWRHNGGKANILQDM